jgi:ATP synthase protein I
MWQLVVGAVLAAGLWGVFGGVAGYSAMLGSLVCVIPNGFLALRLIVPRRDPGAQDLMRAAWIGEIGKLALTVLFFTLVFTLVRPLSAAALFAGFIVTQLVVFSGFLMRSGQEQETKHHAKQKRPDHRVHVDRYRVASAGIPYPLTRLIPANLQILQMVLDITA